MTTNLANFVKPDIESTKTSIRSFIEFITAGAPSNVYFAIAGIARDGRNELEKLAPGYGPKIVFKHFKLMQLEEAVRYSLATIADKRDLYIQCAMMRAIPSQGRGDKTHVAGSTVLWVDLDLNGRTKLQLRDLLATFNPQPTLVVDSGNGFHVYWKLDSFVESLQDIEGRNTTLDRLMQGGQCISYEHLLRIPGSYNFKNADKITPVKLEYLNENAVYGLADFPVAAMEEAEADSSGLEIEEEPYKEEELRSLPADIANAIFYGNPKEKSRSDNDWFVATSLAERGFSPGQILSIFQNPQYAVSGKTLETNGLKYAMHTIKKAFTTAKKRRRVKPRALLQPVIDKMLFNTDKGLRLDLPPQGGSIIEESGGLLEQAGYRFVFDDVENMPFVLTPTGEMIRAVATDRYYNSWVTNITLFTQESRAFKMFQTGIISYIMEHGARAVLKPWSYLDVDRSKYYILTDHTSYKSVSVAKAGDTTLQEVPNGVNNLLFFPSVVTEGKNIQVEHNLIDVQMNDVLSSLFDVTYDYFAVPTHIKALLTCYMLAAPLAGSFIRNGMMPLLHITGRAGRGKSDTLKVISSFLLGSPPESGTTLAAARDIAAKDIIICFDDYEELDKGLREFILTSATGAIKHKKAQDHNVTVKQSNHLLIALTSINDLPTNTLRRRALRVEVSATDYPTANFSSLYKDKLLRNRGLYWSGYIRFIIDRVLARLTMSVLQEMAEKVADKIKVQEFKPHGEFLALCLYIAKELSTIDKRFEFFNDDDSIDPWLAYFGLGEAEILEAYDQLPEMLTAVADRYLSDLAVGKTGPMKLMATTITGGHICQPSTWMEGISVEAENYDGIDDIPFDVNTTLCLSGRIAGWTTTLGRLGFREYFQRMQNPQRQLQNKFNNLAGIVRESDALGEIGVAAFTRSKFYKLGSLPIWMQVVSQVHGGSAVSAPVIKLFYALPGRYKVPGKGPQGAIAKQSSLSALQTIQRRIVDGSLSKEELAACIEMLESLKQRKEKTNE